MWALMSDIWLEVCPDEKIESYAVVIISSEAAALLKSIVVITQSILEYIDTFDRNDRRVERMKLWFKDTFHDAYMKNFLSRFPYGRVKPLVSETGKRQKDFTRVEYAEECLEQNLGLCQIHIWFTSLFSRSEQFPKSIETCCVSIMKYLNGKLILYVSNYPLCILFYSSLFPETKLWRFSFSGAIENLCDSSALPQLAKLLRTLFLKAGPVWYTNRISLSRTLRSIIEASSRLPEKEPRSHLYLIIGDIMLESNSNDLHR